MSWERDPLVAKARLFFGRAFESDREDPVFGLWCALGLELLARAALSSISPTLLAEPDEDHKYLLHALNKGSDRVSPKSIGAAKAFTLCRTLFEQFKDEDFKMSVALINRRNDDLHTGAAAFHEYPSSQWLSGFYRACNTLAIAQGETLDSIFGSVEAKVATATLAEVQNDIRNRVQSTIAAHRKVFEGKSEEERRERTEQAVKQGDKLAHHRHHRTKCPSCGCVALLQGDAFGEAKIKHEDGSIIIHQAVAPTSFACTACELKLTGYQELAAAGLSGHYTRTSEESPEDFYGLVDPGGPDFGEMAMRWLSENGEEYDNE